MCVSACVLLEDIEGHNNWHSKQVCYLDLLSEIATATTLDKAQILEEKKRKRQKIKNIIVYQITN